MNLPRISVVTSCFNAEVWVDHTLRSVLQQQYPNLQYIFIDGASTDGTLNVARRYEDQLAILRSEPDDGQYHGIQKGMALADGEILAWLNGDDIHCPWTLSVVGEVFAQFPEVDWIIGTPSYMNGRGQCTRVSGSSGTAYPRNYIRQGWFRNELAGYLQQESMFWRRSLWERVGGLDLSLKLAADFDLWRRFAQHAELVSVNVPLALFRQHTEQRSAVGLQRYEAEVASICAGLPRAPALWSTLARQGEMGRHACRMLSWHRSPVLSYSPAAQRWIKTTSLRPLARTSVADLLLERTARSLAQ